MAVQYFPMVARLADGSFEPSLPGQGGTVVHVGTADPAEISEDATGEQMIPGSRLTVGTDAPLVPGFFSLDDAHYLDWLADNGLRVPLFSPEGSAQAAQAAQEAVEALRGQVTDFINTGGRLHIRGSLDSTDDLPEQPGGETDAWLVDGDLWAWTEENGWTNTGRVQGPKGDPGPAGGADWADLTGVPEVFAPAAHTHPAGDITGTLDAARIPALPYRGSNWVPGAEQVTGLAGFVDDRAADLTPVVLLDEVELTGASGGAGQRLDIPPELRGQFRRYEIHLSAGVGTVHDRRRICVYINGDQSVSYEDISATMGVGDPNNVAGGFPTALPRSAWASTGIGSATIILTPDKLGETRAVAWHTSGYGRATDPSENFTFVTGGTWAGSEQSLTHFRVASSAEETWGQGSQATLWGHR